MFLIFSGLGSASSGIEGHVLGVLVSGSECLWTLVALAPVGCCWPPAPGCFLPVTEGVRLEELSEKKPCQTEGMG